jgi:outer membrane lipoprotein-sorting protein
MCRTLLFLVLLVLLPGNVNVSFSSASAAEQDAKAVFQDEPAAHAIYDKMVDTLRKANSFSYVSHYTLEGKGGFAMRSSYQAWLKKPNYFRVEAIRQQKPDAKTMPSDNKTAGAGEKPGQQKPDGILIGDGKTLWIYWPNGRHRDRFEDAATYEKTKFTKYITRPAPPGGHSIGHETGWLGAGMSMPVLDPSTFFGYTDSLHPYLDGVKSNGTETIDGEVCDKIELSFMKHQRSWFVWISQRDHLPRRLKEIVRVSFDIIISEEWSSLVLNADMPDALFAWKPPKDWTEWKRPPLEAGLLKPGTKAPEFDLASADGNRIKLSDFRGRIVWFYVWRAG